MKTDKVQEGGQILIQFVWISLITSKKDVHWIKFNQIVIKWLQAMEIA